jgi:hypothetical protein
MIPTASHRHEGGLSCQRRAASHTKECFTRKAPSSTAQQPDFRRAGGAISKADLGRSRLSSYQWPVLDLQRTKPRPPIASRDVFGPFTVGPAFTACMRVDGSCELSTNNAISHTSSKLRHPRTAGPAHRLSASNSSPTSALGEVRASRPRVDVARLFAYAGRHACSAHTVPLFHSTDCTRASWTKGRGRPALLEMERVVNPSPHLKLPRLHALLSAVPIVHLTTGLHRRHILI